MVRGYLRAPYKMLLDTENNSSIEPHDAVTEVRRLMPLAIEVALDRVASSTMPSSWRWPNRDTADGQLLEALDATG